MKGTRENPITESTEVEDLINQGWMRSGDYMRSNPDLKSTSHLYFKTRKGEVDKIYFEEGGSLLCLYRKTDGQSRVGPVSVQRPETKVTVASIDVRDNLARVIDIGTRKGLLSEEEEFRLRKSFHEFMTR